MPIKGLKMYDNFLNVGGKMDLISNGSTKRVGFKVPPKKDTPAELKVNKLSSNGNSGSPSVRNAQNNGVALAISETGVERRKWFYKGSRSLGRCYVEYVL